MAASKKGENNGGGRKPGDGGRSPAPSTAISKVRAHAIIASGNAPLDVMLRNMHFWDDQVIDLQAKFETMVASLQSRFESGEELDANEIKQANSLMKNLMAARVNSQSCAVDAAPYVHPRLAQIQMKAPPSKEVVKVTAALPPAAAGRKEDRSYRDNYDQSKVIPFAERMPAKAG